MRYAALPQYGEPGVRGAEFDLSSLLPQLLLGADLQHLLCCTRCLSGTEQVLMAVLTDVQNVLHSAKNDRADCDAKLSTPTARG